MFYLSGFADEIHESIDEQIRVLKELNIHSIEVRGVDGRNISTLTLDETQSLYEKLTVNGISVSAIGSPLGKISLDDPFEPHLALFDHVMQQAQILKTKYVRMFSFYNAVDRCEEVMARLEVFLQHTPAGITLLHENEKGIYGDNAERCLDILKHFENAPMRATFDPANFIQVGEDVPKAFELLKPYITYMHVKDAQYSDGEVVPAGMGDGHWPLLIENLRDMQFDGFLSLEPHLTNFIGFAELEQETVEKADKSQGATLFRLAAQKLKVLLKEEEIR
ncbi:MAG: sugar phosphate isomerase/epimerase [Firmicutes bacterium]|nr:sugar phosphate isomerase/epimerase [Bacillota bacterium]